MHDTEWRFCGSRDVIGIAICNFPGTKLVPQHGLDVVLGDRLRLVEENGAWCRGWIVDKPSEIGIFPCSAVHLKPVLIESHKSGQETIVYIQETPVAQDIVTSLKEWSQISRTHFLAEDDLLPHLRKLALSLMEYRKQILSGALPVDELRKIQRDAVQKLDEGNILLGLDTIIRNEEGLAVNLDTLTLPETFRLFKESVSNNLSPPVKHNETQLYSMPCCFMVTIRNVAWKIGDHAELIVSLFDDSKGAFITENCVLEWRRDKCGFVNGEKVLFADLKRFSEPSRVYLVCHIVRKGPMEWKENGTDGKKPSSQTVRRPFGVAVLDVSSALKHTESQEEAEKKDIVPVVLCGDSDSLLSATKKAMIFKPSANDPRSFYPASIGLSGNLLLGSVKQVREEFPHLFVGNPPVSRIIGYPEVIVPTDMRNDIYITIDRAEFKNSGRNVEVSVCVCDDKGAVLPRTVCAGAGVDLTDQYVSVVYYHRDAPAWNETLKITVGFEQFASSHVRFLFKHRSSNETKDKAEKPFALGFLPLKSEDGTALQDRTYKLALYRIDQKNFTEKAVSPAYLQFKEFEATLDVILTNGSAKPQATAPSYGCYSYSMREFCSVSSLVCSTKLTQNVNLLGLLMWRSNEFALEANLKALPHQPGVQVVRYLRDILDVLFEIMSLSDRRESADVDAVVFECLVFIIDLVTREFHNFRPILDLYIKEDFCAMLAYHKLIARLSSLINPNSMDEMLRKFFIKTMKSLEYIFKFIIQSRLLYAQMNQNHGEDQFKDTLEVLLTSLVDFMRLKDKTFQTAQGTALRYIPTIIPDVIKVLDPVTVSNSFIKMISNVPRELIFQQQIDCILAVVRGPLFRLADCRAVLLPFVCQYLHELEDAKRECVGASNILMEILVLLSDASVEETLFFDLSILIDWLLRDVVRSVIQLADKGSEPVEENFLVIMLSIFRLMDKSHYDQFVASFLTDRDLVIFLQEIFISFRGSLFSKSVFPKEWSDMIMLQNTIMLQSLSEFAVIIRERFLDPFQQQLWNNFFQCAVEFCTQESLQLERLSENKQQRIRRRYGDMRLKMCFEVRRMWNSLGGQKRNFVPDLVASLLDMSLIPVEELRVIVIAIFFDMMQCEFRIPKSVHSTEQSMTTNRREHHEHRTIQGKLAAFETHMIKALDAYIEGGRGDLDYVELFEQTMQDRCNNNAQMRDKSLRLVDQLVKQMKLLLEYRDVMASPDVDTESRMCCTVNLLDFYEGIYKREMYIRYLYKLRDLHLHLGNFTEVAFTLERHAGLLLWTDEPLPSTLRSAEFPGCETHRELKEKLFYEMIRYFDMGKSWEYAINGENCVFKELLTLYETDTFEYRKLSNLLREMAGFYDKVISPHETRVPCEYFRVAYFGTGFPLFWRNRAFVYRGKECDNIRDFTERMQNRFPGCITLKSMDSPGKDIYESDKMYLQIWKVEPVNQIEDRFSGKQVSHRIRNFYLFNDVRTFTYHRRLHSNGKDSDFGSLWLERTIVSTRSSLPGILRWSEIRDSLIEQVSPIQTAIETLQAKNDDIYRLVEKYIENPQAELDPQAGSILGGVVDPAVNGGISNYEKAFFTPAYFDAHQTPEDREKIDALKDLIAMQIPYLEAALEVYGQKVKDSMRPFYLHIHECFKKQKTHVEAHYGVKPTVFPKIVPKRPNQAGRSYSNVEIRKNGSFVSYDLRDSAYHTPPRDSGIGSSRASAHQPASDSCVSTLPSVTLTARMSLPGKKGLRPGSLSKSTLSLARYHRETSTTPVLPSPTTTPIELSQTLQSQRPPRRDMEKEKRNSRPGSGSYTTGRRPSSGTIIMPEEDNDGVPRSPPPLPEKKTSADHWPSPGNGLVDNGFVTTPRRRLKTFDGGVSFGEEDSVVPPEKPPLPLRHPVPPDLPPKSNSAHKLLSVSGEYDPSTSPTPPKIPSSPGRSSRSTSVTPPPVPGKPPHLLKDRGSADDSPSRKEMESSA